MVTIRWKILGIGDATASLCTTCTWGLVRKGRKPGEEETFCRLLTPCALVHFAVNECTGYSDGRVPEGGSGRRIGFATAMVETVTGEVLTVAGPDRNSY